LWLVGEQVVEAFGFGDGQGDQPGVGGGLLVGAYGHWGEGVGAGAGFGGGGGGDQGEVAVDGGVEADLGVVVAELVLAEFVVFLDGPAAAGYGGRDG
jgi:hypothetical protein